jgi:hypothetical protein
MDHTKNDPKDPVPKGKPQKEGAKPATVVHVCNSSYLEGRDRGISIGEQPEQSSRL